MYSKLPVFYWDSYEDKGISGDRAKELNLEDAIEYMEMLPDSDGSFLGLILPDGSVIQFMYTEKHELFLDIPDKEKEGAYNKTISLEECLEIIKEVFGGKHPEDIEGIKFVSWF